MPNKEKMDYFSSLLSNRLSLSCIKGFDTKLWAENIDSNSIQTLGKHVPFRRSMYFYIVIIIEI